MELHVITGRLGNAAQTRTVGDKIAISFPVAVDHSYVDASGNRVNRATWYDCTLWRKPGQDGIVKFLVKGAQVTVQGDEVTAGTYTNQAGETMTSLRLRVVTVEPKWPDQAPTSQPQAPATVPPVSDDVPF